MMMMKLLIMKLLIKIIDDDSEESNGYDSDNDFLIYCSFSKCIQMINVFVTF